MSFVVSSSTQKIEALYEAEQKLIKRGYNLAKLWLGIDIDTPQEISDLSVFVNEKLLADIPKKFNKMLEENEDKIKEITTLFLFEMDKIPKEISSFPSLEIIGIEGFKSKSGSIPNNPKLKTIVLNDDTFRGKPESLSKLKSVEEVVIKKIKQVDFIVDLPNLNLVVYPGDFKKVLSCKTREISEQREINFYDSEKKVFHEANGALI